MLAGRVARVIPFPRREAPSWGPVGGIPKRGADVRAPGWLLETLEPAPHDVRVILRHAPTGRVWAARGSGLVSALAKLAMSCERSNAGMPALRLEDLRRLERAHSWAIKWRRPD